MSTLIVSEVLVEKPPERITRQFFAWVKARIEENLQSIESKYSFLSDNSSQKEGMLQELKTDADFFSNPDNAGTISIPELERRFQFFFQKSDRLQISLVQQQCEENESRMMESSVLTEIDRLLIEMLPRMADQKNPRFLELKERFTLINQESRSIKEIKILFEEVLILWYHSEQRANTIQTRIQRANAVLYSLQYHELSLKNLEIIQGYLRQLSALSHQNRLYQEKRLQELEKEISIISDEITGKIHVDLNLIRGDRSEKTDEKQEEELILKAKRKIFEYDAHFFRERIRSLDIKDTVTTFQEPIDNETSPERLALLRDNLQLEYGLIKDKLPEITIIREQLEAIVQILSLEPDTGGLNESALELYHEPSPELRDLAGLRRLYLAYYLNEISHELSDREWEDIIGKIFDKIKGKGYSLSYRGRIGSSWQGFRKRTWSIYTPFPGYSLFLSVNPLDELVFRLVRIVDSSEPVLLSPGELEEQDMACVSAWNIHYDEICNELKEEKIVLVERLRRNPPDVTVQYLTRFDLLTDEHIS